MGKLAIKRLTNSDLTLFYWQFVNRNAGNQKSINLNANVFIDELYPSLLSTDEGRVGRIPVDLFLLGPGNARVHNLQRKILKGATYKNWRLDGEYIRNPDDDTTRYDVLEQNDYVIFEFEGDLFPKSARAVFVAKNVPDDARLHQGLTDSGLGSMSSLSLSQLRLIVHASGTPESHPIYELLLDSAIEDASLGGLEGMQRLLSRNTGRQVTRSELERARQRAADVGLMGEELINGYFSERQESGQIQGFEWTAGDNAIAPFDFLVHESTDRKIEVKSTMGDFGQVIHISIGELIEMERSPGQYDLYRVYKLDELKGRLRIAENVSAFAATVITQLRLLPVGVMADSVSVHPVSMHFGPEIEIDLTEPVPGEFVGTLFPEHDSE